jgi:hypothetical protein
MDTFDKAAKKMEDEERARQNAASGISSLETAAKKDIGGYRGGGALDIETAEREVADTVRKDPSRATYAAPAVQSADRARSDAAYGGRGWVQGVEGINKKYGLPLGQFGEDEAQIAGLLALADKGLVKLDTALEADLRKQLKAHARADRAESAYSSELGGTSQAARAQATDRLTPKQR